MTVERVIEKAAELIEGGWVQESDEDTINGKRHYCIRGALLKATMVLTHEYPYNRAEYKASMEIVASTISPDHDWPTHEDIRFPLINATVTSFNDEDGRSVEDVLLVLKKALEDAHED